VILSLTPLFKVWRGGVEHAINMNRAHSVTFGGSLFLTGAFAPDDGADNPFFSVDVHPALPRAPAVVSPVSPLCPIGRSLFLEWSRDIWIEIGSQVVPPSLPVQGAATNLGE
jgi:hypothetical protein